MNTKNMLFAYQQGHKGAEITQYNDWVTG